MITQRSSALNNKGIRSLARALHCPGVDKRPVLSAVVNQIPVWSAGPTPTGDGQVVGSATQNVLSILGSRDVAGVTEARDALLGDGCLSDPFLLSGLYDVLRVQSLHSFQITERQHLFTVHCLGMALLRAQQAEAVGKRIKRLRHRSVRAELLN